MALTALFLALILSLTACGNSSNRENGQAGSADQETEQTAALTLADGEAKLIYAKDSYAVAAFHGPDGDIAASFCDADGNIVGGMVGCGHPSDGWTLIISTWSR